MGTAGLLVTTHRNDAYLFVAPAYAKNRKIENVMYLHFFIHIFQCLKLSFLDILAQYTLFVEEKMYT